MTGKLEKDDVRAVPTRENGKSGPSSQPSGPYFDPDDPSRAIQWIRQARQEGHGPACGCHICMAARPIVRFATRNTDCECGLCYVCWARQEVHRGRI